MVNLTILKAPLVFLKGKQTLVNPYTSFTAVLQSYP